MYNFGKRTSARLAALVILTFFAHGASAQPQPEPPLAAPPSAEKPTALDRAAIENFYAQAAQSQISGLDQAVAFLKLHASEKLSSTMKVISRLPGSPQAQTEQWTLDKRQLILKTKEGARTTRIQSLKTNILSVKLSDDGKHAKVKNTSFGVAMVRVPTPEGASVLMKAEQSMLCDDELILAQGGLIQFEKSLCNVEVLVDERGN